MGWIGKSQHALVDGIAVLRIVGLVAADLPPAESPDLAAPSQGPVGWALGSSRTPLGKRSARRAPSRTLLLARVGQPAAAGGA